MNKSCKHAILLGKLPRRVPTRDESFIAAPEERAEQMTPKLDATSLSGQNLDEIETRRSILMHNCKSKKHLYFSCMRHQCSLLLPM